jgi:acetylglutamate kinase
MKILILKLSGKAIDQFYNDSKWIDAVIKIKSLFDGLVIVHGAGKKITEWSESFGIKASFVNGHRVTDNETMEVVAAVQAGLLNSKIISSLQSNNIEAMGLSGIDRGLFVAKYLNEDLGFVGYPEQNGKADWLFTLIKQNVIPVFSSVCRDAEGNLMNVNADLFAKALALTLKADSVVFLSDVDGVKLNGNFKSFITDLEIMEGIKSGEINNGMIPKLESCIELLNNGINKIWIGKDFLELDLNNLLLENNTKGSWIVHSQTVTA